MIRSDNNKPHKPMRRYSRKRVIEHDLYIEAVYVVRQRSEGRCEVVENGERCHARADEIHHVFGRTTHYFRVRPDFLMAVCRPHHRQVTGQIKLGLNRELREALKWQAIERTWFSGFPYRESFTSLSADAYVMEMVGDGR